MSKGEAAHPTWVKAHLARARQRVRAVRRFIWIKRATAPIYSHPRLGGEGGREEMRELVQNFWKVKLCLHHLIV